MTSYIMLKKTEVRIAIGVSNLIKLRTVIFLVKRMVIQDGYTMLIKLV